MDAIISIEIERMEDGIERLKYSKIGLSGLFNEEILDFVRSEALNTISIVSNESYENEVKRFLIARSLGRLNGVENTINFLSPKKFGGEVPYSIQLLVLEIKSLENSITRILMNL